MAIVGPSGCGKSTLFNVLLGILPPVEGQIRMAGLDLAQLGLDGLRELVGTVLQDDVLFAGSLSDNISFFDPQPDMPWLLQCAQMAAIHDDIQAMPMGYNTLVGDMGTVLSGGQKQRVMLARALYKKPRILFLDEATSHLDVHCEQRVNAAIRPVQPRAREEAHPNWQDLLHALEAEQRIQAVSALRRVSEDLRLPIIEQWQHRCAGGTVSNPFGYLMTLIQRAVQGKFNASWAPEEPAERAIPAAERPSRAPAPPSPTTPEQHQVQMRGDTRTGSEVLSRLKDLIRPRHGSSVPSERGDEP